MGEFMNFRFFCYSIVFLGIFECQFTKANRISLLNIIYPDRQPERLCIGVDIDDDIIYEFVPEAAETASCLINKRDWLKSIEPLTDIRKQWLDSSFDLSSRKILWVREYKKAETGLYRFIRSINARNSGERASLLPPLTPAQIAEEVARRLAEPQPSLLVRFASWYKKHFMDDYLWS